MCIILHLRRMVWGIIEHQTDYPCYAPHLNLCRTNIKRASINNKFFIVDFYKHYKRMGYVIVPKPHFSSSEALNCHCGHFDWNICVICHVAVVAGSTALNHAYRLGHSSECAGESIFAIVLGVFRVYKNARPN